MRAALFPYQLAAVRHVIGTPTPLLLIDMGMGKTLILLAALYQLLSECSDSSPSKVLIIAPKRVAEETWPTEICKWDTYNCIKYSLVAGDKDARISALKADAHVYIISRDNIRWLVSRYPNPAKFPFDMIVIDELSSFKSHDSGRFKALRKVTPYCKRVVGMTGTPVANGLMGLWSQVYLLDGGKRIGRTITAFRSEYFSKDPTPYPSYSPRSGALPDLLDRISDISISMKSEDYLQLPDYIPVEHALKVPEPVKEAYKKLKEDMLVQIDGQQVTALTAGALSNKLLQLCGGRIYTDPLHVSPATVHDLKLDALTDLIEAANGQPVLVYYTFVSEAERIKAAFPHAVDIKTPGAIEKWNRGAVSLLLAHPASAGHGLNLQQGGHIIIWFNITYDLELYQQANKRLHRVGQTHPVTVHHITLKGCLDSHILNSVLSKKATLQDTLLNALRRDTLPADSNTKSGDGGNMDEPNEGAGGICPSV